MKIRYLLKKRGEKADPNPIYVALYLNDQTELIYTKERCTVKEWNVKDRIPKDHKSDTFLKIEKIKRDVQKIIQSFESQDKPVTPYTVKEEYLISQSDKTESQRSSDVKAKECSKTVPFFAKKWMEEDLFGYQPSTQKAIRESIKQFISYLEINSLSNLTNKNLDSKIIKGYERYLQEVKQLANSTHGKRMKHLRWFLKTINYDVNSINIRNHRKDIIALSLEELTKLEEVDVMDNPEYQKAKDMFLLGCYTGQRISDLKRINETHLIDGKICMNLQKNKKFVTIPIRNETKEILKRYGMASPKIIDSAVNKAIKDVCAKAGIDKVLTVKSNKAGRDIESQIPKFKLITTHTASKTFITLAHERFDLTIPEIAAIVGKDIKTLIGHYFQLPLESAIKKMED